MKRRHPMFGVPRGVVEHARGLFERTDQAAGEWHFHVYVEFEPLVQRQCACGEPTTLICDFCQTESCAACVRPKQGENCG